MNQCGSLFHFCFSDAIHRFLSTTPEQEDAKKPFTISSKNLKELSQKFRQSSRRDRLLLREYRLRKWLSLSENEIGTKLSNEISKSKKKLHSNSPHTAQQSHRDSRTMQERALSNFSKIEAALLSNSFSHQQEVQNPHPLFRSADSGVGCDLANEKNNKLQNSNCSSSAEIANYALSNSREKSSDDKSQFKEKQNKFHRPGVHDFTQSTFSSCSFHPTDAKKQSKNPYIVACSWYQNSKCISQTDVHSQNYQKNLSTSAFDTNRHQQLFSPNQQESPDTGSISHHPSGKVLILQLEKLINQTNLLRSLLLRQNIYDMRLVSMTMHLNNTLSYLEMPHITKESITVFRSHDTID